MRRFSLLFAFCSFLFISHLASAETPIKLDEDSILFNISQDVQDDLRNLWPTPQNIKWSRQVYREIFFADSTTMNRANFLLKYPDEPVTSSAFEGGINKLTTKQNLFWLIFKLVINHKVPVYQSNDYLTFTENDKITNDSILLSNLKYIPESKGKYVVKDVYTRSLNSSIIGYLLKENYYFDAEVSELRSQVVAIAPLIESTTMGGTRDYTIPFWVTYESIVPWLINYTLMASESNNADVISFDTYFKKRMFKGAIMKIENPMNLTIAKECSQCCADSLQQCIKRKQLEVESQINEFDKKQLWAQPYIEKRHDTKSKQKQQLKSKPIAVLASPSQEKKESNANHIKTIKVKDEPDISKNKVVSDAQSVVPEITPAKVIPESKPIEQQEITKVAQPFKSKTETVKAKTSKRSKTTPKVAADEQ